MLNETYYDIAMIDLQYMQLTLNSHFYNNITIHAQQVVEKLLKSVVELVCPDPTDLLRSHNLRNIIDEINNNEKLDIDRKDMAYLKDFYFDARYPGENYTQVTREDCTECLEIMYNVIDRVNQFRRERGLDTQVYNRMMLEEYGIELENTEDNADLEDDEAWENEL